MRPDATKIPWCPLCGELTANSFFQDRQRDYYRCSRCRLVYVPPSQHLAPEDEVAEYRLHQNCPGDFDYRRFLGRLLIPLSRQLAPASEGLDFGCGPGPTLSVMLTEIGHSMSIYDPYFFPDPGIFSKSYDFISMSEVAEHLRCPGQDLDRLWALLKPGGWLGIMTKLVLEETAFSCWHYKNDPTHVAFFSRETFQWLANQWRASLHFACSDVILLQKSTCNPV